MKNPAALLDTDALVLRVGERLLIDQLTLQVRAGELWCVLGPNGSGKTTLLHTLAGLRDTPTAGLRWRGQPAATWRPDEAARWRGLLPQTVHDTFAARVLDVVLMSRHPHLGRWAWEGEADDAIARAALKAVDADALAERDVTRLSGGERQRVAIAALLAQGTPLLLLDEPTAHLDLKHQAIVLTHLRHLVTHNGRAAVVALHDLNLAARYATHALVLGPDGRAQHGRIAEVMTEAHLSVAFGVAVRRVRCEDRWLFVA